MIRARFDHEVDGRWIAEYLALPGVVAYGATRQEAVDQLRVLMREVAAEIIEYSGPVPADLVDL